MSNGSTMALQGTPGTIGSAMMFRPKVNMPMKAEKMITITAANAAEIRFLLLTERTTRLHSVILVCRGTSRVMPQTLLPLHTQGAIQYPYIWPLCKMQ
jgi:hypothetical protein